MFNQVKIGPRLFASYLALAAIALLIGVMGGAGLYRMKRADTFVYDKTTVPLGQLATLQGKVQSIRFTLLQGAITGSDQLSRAWFQQAEQAFQEAGKALEGYSSTIIDAGDVLNYHQMVDSLAQLARRSAEIQQLRRSGRSAEALALLNGTAAQEAEARSHLLVKVTDYNLEAAKRVFADNRAQANGAMAWMAVVIGAGVLLALGLGLVTTRGIVDPMRQVVLAYGVLTRGAEAKLEAAEAIARGDFSQEVKLEPELQLEAQRRGDETGALLLAAQQLSRIHAALDRAFQTMTRTLREAREANDQRDWLKTGANELEQLLRGDPEAADRGERSLSFLCRYLGAGTGVLCQFREAEQELQVIARFAFSERHRRLDRFRLGEGILGQAALEKRIICLDPVPEHYGQVHSALGSALPRVVLALPMVHDGMLLGALELGLFRPPRAMDFQFLESAMEALAIAFSVNQSRRQVLELLAQSQVQEEELRVQQEELQESNEVLEERAHILEEQRELIRSKSLQMELTSRELRARSEQLERVSAFKTQFLANMSHELRTPLNSMMILSSILRENRTGNLTAEQVAFAKTIHGSGGDLLNLINDILDLAKIESGRMEFLKEAVDLDALTEQLEAALKPLAEQKNISLRVILEASAPRHLHGDEQRIQQILKNLLANAIKFTAQGGVSLRLFVPGPEQNPLATLAVAFSVEDTGVGIPADQHEAIFQAFRQADGTTSRKFGGTGLGLSISSQLARSMGGTIQLQSLPGQGSCFTLYLPLEGQERPPSGTAPGQGQPAGRSAPVPEGPPVPHPVLAGRKVLIVDDDMRNVYSLSSLLLAMGMQVREAATGLEALAALEADPSLELVLMDMMMPEMDGFTAIRQMRSDPRFQTLPILALTAKAMKEDREACLRAGASDYLSKPMDPERLLAMMTLWLDPKG